MNPRIFKTQSLPVSTVDALQHLNLVISDAVTEKLQKALIARFHIHVDPLRQSEVMLLYNESSSLKHTTVNGSFKNTLKRLRHFCLCASPTRTSLGSSVFLLLISAALHLSIDFLFSEKIHF
ncbi:hypothetical protein L596_018677 [Steinernema carpocapsae]|uniref:Uncharacterized protein n=1 Tax=Steinernema carpocapsae TaxID=34508 RepID=A0A4U5N5V2_STECR|nr:hypothetical protein L596_018677 [Steinernema carpocapsae]